METYKCFDCASTFTEADRDWDIAVNTGRCPRCHKTLRGFPQKTALSGMPSSFGQDKLISSYGQYKTLTEKKDWAGIFLLNGFDFGFDFYSSGFSTRKEVNRLPEQLQLGEVVFFFATGTVRHTGDSTSYDYGIRSWVVVLTDRRFLFLDAAMLTSSMNVHSILHKNVQAVRVAQGFVLGKINIDTGGRSTLIEGCEKKIVKVFGDLSNEWLQVLEERKSTPQESAAAPVESGLDKLKKLGELKALGLLSEQEFDDAKAKVLPSL